MSWDHFKWSRSRTNFCEFLIFNVIFILLPWIGHLCLFPACSYGTSASLYSNSTILILVYGLNYTLKLWILSSDRFILYHIWWLYLQLGMIWPLRLSQLWWNMLVEGRLEVGEWCWESGIRLFNKLFYLQYQCAAQRFYHDLNQGWFGSKLDHQTWLGIWLRHLIEPTFNIVLYMTHL